MQDSNVAPIRLLVPDLPRAEALLPYLRRIDEARWYTNNGPLVREFEQRLGLLVGTSQTPPSFITTSSGTAALELGLRALALPVGSRVLVPSFTFPATAIAVQRAGYEPLLADVDERLWILTPDLAESLMRKHPVRAVVPVAAFGVALDIEAWDALAQRARIAVVVDAAAALGVVRPGRHVGAAYSFHATKPLGIGEGGGFATYDPALADRVRKLANYGFEQNHIAAAGTNAKLSEYAAAVGLAQLDRAESVTASRAAVWRAYREALREVPELAMQQGFDGHSPANLVVRIAAATRCSEALERSGIESRRWYCPPVHQHAAFESLARAGALHVTDDLAQHALGLPFHGNLSPDHVRRIVHTLGEALT